MNASAIDRLPVVVIGAGPIGLAAAAHLVERGLDPLVLEAGPTAGSAVREWSHVRLFSTWAELVDPAAEKLLAPTGWVRPDAAVYPTGGDWAERYLQPLADVLGDTVRYGVRVTGVARAGRDRIVDSGRDEQPFTVHIETSDGREERLTARAVIDASGTWSTPSPMGADGLAALGEKAAADRVSYRVPDVDDPAVRARYAGRRTAVIGSGASAFTALALLAELAAEAPGTHAVWVLRRGIGATTYGGGEADQLPHAEPWACAPRRPSRPVTRARSPDSAPGPSPMTATDWSSSPTTAAARTPSTRSSSSPASAPTSPSSPSSASASTNASRPRRPSPR
ncbi:cation diffusion facilitator CzcD-associated flavoprotein CzcO [Streptomyces canus]|nr:cation diffusion facilitator CzcD-associated flavoprotein CzcO [Streptomyces canus]